MRQEGSGVLLVWVSLCSILVCPPSLFAQEPAALESLDYSWGLVDSIASLIEQKYVLVEMAPVFAGKLRAKGETGAYDQFRSPADLAERITADLREITSDAHITLRVKTPSEPGERTVGSLHHPMRYSRMGHAEHLGFHKLEWLDGNVGYLDLRRFYHLSESKEMLDAAMAFLSTADAIIIDVRENQGGSGETLPYLCSYFLEYPTQLTGHYSREDDFLTEFWTAREIAGRRRTEVPLFVLTSDRTFSAAEAFAYDMKVTNRGTIVGDSTRGGANSVDLYQLDNQFEIYISTARSVNPITSSNWEGTGVIPDVVVPADVALDSAVVLASLAAEESAAAREAELNNTVGRMQVQVDSADALYRQGANAAADHLMDSAFRIASDLDLASEFFIDVLAYNYTSKPHEQTLYAILQRKIDLFPESATAYGTMAYAYQRHGKNDLAIECLEKVLELDPDDRNAPRMIERLQNR